MPSSTVIFKIVMGVRVSTETVFTLDKGKENKESCVPYVKNTLRFLEISRVLKGNFQFSTRSVCQGGDRSSVPTINLGRNERQVLCIYGWHNCKLFLIM